MVSRFCTRCGQLLPTNATACPRCNAPVVAASPAPAATTATPTLSTDSSIPPARRSCANCKAAMRWIGHYSLRASGSMPPPGAGGEGAETLLPFSLYYCQSCGKFDFYYPGT